MNGSQYGPYKDDEDAGTSKLLEEFGGSSEDGSSTAHPQSSSVLSHRPTIHESSTSSRRTSSRASSKLFSVQVPSNQPPPNPYDHKEIDRRHRCRKKLFSLLKAERKSEEQLESMIQVIIKAVTRTGKTSLFAEGSGFTSAFI